MNKLHKKVKKYKSIFNKDLSIVTLFVAILMIIIIPLPKFFLDFFLIASLTLSFLVLFISLYMLKPSIISKFPTLIFVLLFFGLSVNLATTKFILREGHNGSESISYILTAFKDFILVGDMTTVIIIFIIVSLINFIIITKSGMRVAEVSARFALDSLPGKQMKIDADLNAGIIDEAEATKRRETLQNKEVDFYNIVDGLSKVIKANVIASMIITLVGLIGGVMLGVFQHKMSVSQSIDIYTILTISAGLIVQISTLFLSVATTAMVIKFNTNTDNFSSDTMVTLLIEDSKFLIIVGIVFIVLSMIPTIPMGIFLLLGIILSNIGYMIKSRLGKNT